MHPLTSNHVILTLSTCLALMFTGTEKHFEVIIQSLAFSMLIFPRFMYSWISWFALFSFQSCTIWFSWEHADNHQYLIAYWFLLLSISQLESEEGRETYSSRARVAELLVGSAMLLAVVHKVLCADYMAGSFFKYTALTDGRFSAFTQLMTSIDASMLEFNKGLLSTILDTKGTHALRGVNEVDDLSTFLTYWTIAIETLIGVFFILPFQTIAQHVLLFMFAITTYPVAPVIGFCWVLCCLGFVSLHNKEGDDKIHYLGWCYVAVMIAAVLFRYPINLFLA